MNNDTIEWIIGFIVAVLIIFGCYYGMYKLQEYKCYTKATMQEMEYSYGIFQGCMVKQENGKWIDYNRLRYME